MKTVYTKEQLAETLKKGETALVKGSLASEIRKKYETRKKLSKGAVIAGGAIAVAGVVAAPFTGGTSLAGTAAGLGAMGLTIGAVTISTTCDILKNLESKGQRLAEAQNHLEELKQQQQTIIQQIAQFSTVES